MPVVFPLGVQNCDRIPKAAVSLFLFFTPLFLRFTFCRTSKTIDLDKTYRFVSKNFNFMVCGSVLSRFCIFRTFFIVLCKWPSQFHESLIMSLDFPLGAQTCKRIPKTGVSRFCDFFTGLFRHFRLSRTSRTIDLDETYRLVSWHVVRP